MRITLCCLTIAVASSIVGLSCSSAVLTGPPEPCSLLTSADVEHIISKLNSPPQANKEGAARWCDAQFANDKDAVEVWVLPTDAIDRARKKDKTPLAVHGLGEETMMDRGAFGLEHVDWSIEQGSTTVKIALKETVSDEEKVKAVAQVVPGRF